MRRTGLVSALLALPALLLGAACAGGGQPAETDAAVARTTTPRLESALETDTAAPASTPTQDDDGALSFTARRLGGGTVKGTDYAGGDVVLWMWAPWCPQCNREAPHVADAQERFGDDVTFIGVPGHDGDDAHHEFVDQHGLDGMVQAVDEDGSLWARYGVNYQPAWVFIDDDGTYEVVAGGLYDALEARVQALVEQ